jgi:hypothetical protein
VDAAGNRTNATAPTNGTGGGQDTQVVIVDTSGGTVQPSGQPDPNATATVDITSMTTDSGASGTDFVTNDNLLTYSGTVAGFTANGDKVKVELLAANGTTVIATAYVDVTATTGGAGTWNWAYETTQADGQYTVRATIVDAAGNRVNSAVGGQDTQVIVIDTSATVDITGMTTDSGVSGSDFITSDKSLTYSGTVSNFTANGNKVKVELLAADGTSVLETAFVDVTGASSTTAGAGAWTWTRTTDHADGQYTLRATVVDTAGNRTNATAPTNGTGGGQDTQVVIVDTSGGTVQPSGQPEPNTTATVDITSMTTDSGVSGADFITSDKSLTYSGTVSNFTANGNKVKVELLAANGTTVLDTAYVDVTRASGTTAGAGTWSWTRAAEHTDGQYTLRATIVDTAGNRTNATAPTNGTGGGQDTQVLKIITGSDADLNNLKISIASLGDNQDSGISSNDFLTNVKKLSFKGSFSSGDVAFNAGAKILAQVIDMSGEILSMSYQDLNMNGEWVFNNESNILGVDGKNTQYLLKASIVDLAGNVLKTTDQSFVVDLKNPSFTPSGKSSTNTSDGSVTHSAMSIDAGIGDKKIDAENGIFYFTDKNNSKIDTPKAGVLSFYNAGDFVINFKDLSGNEVKFSNPSRWIFNLNSEIVFSKPDYVSPSTFNDGELAGSIGIYSFGPAEQLLDLSSLHSSSPVIGSRAAVNHIVMTDGVGNDTLKLTTSDVLALGVQNSFISTGVFKDRQQMRIDGDALDKVLLDDLLGGSTFEWAKAVGTVELNQGQRYALYSNDALGLDLFIQQGIVTTIL